MLIERILLEDDMDKKGEKKLNVGKDSVVIGNVEGNVGDGSVVIYPTDERGNVILNKSMAIGRNAHAGPDSIAIGAGAGAGSDLGVALSEIRKIIDATQDSSLIDSFGELCTELDKPKKDKSKILWLWDRIKPALTAVNVAGSVASITTFIQSLS